MPSINIYVNDELKNEMAAYDLSWSQIAAAAIRHAIQLERTKTVDVIEQDLERLRTSRMTSSERRHAEGVATGKEWALKTADYEELERVASADELVGNKDETASALASLVLDDEHLRWNEVSDQMEALFGRGSPSLEEIQGFVEGAKEIFDKV